MQLLARSFISAVCLGFIVPLSAVAQDVAPRPGGEAGDVYGAWSPTPEHRDAHHGHNRVYPDRGAVFRDAPRGAITVNYAGLAYRFYNGVWFEPRGPAFIVVVPPIGLVVPSLPPFATSVVANGESYLYANDTYYLPRPDLGGYEVVNAPAEPAPSVTMTTAGGTAPVGPDADADAVVHPLAPSGAAPLAASTAAAAASAVAPAPAAPAPAPAAPATVALTSYAPAAPSRVPGTSLYTYPRNGQSSEQQARDRYECYRFAVTQTGYDPLRTSGVASGSGGDLRSDYQRAQTACFEGLGYTVR